MKHLISKRRKVKIIFVSIFAILVFALLIPCIYKNVFMQEEDFITKHESCQIYDFFGKFSDLEIDKGVSLDLRFLEDGHLISRVNIEDFDLAGVILSANFLIKGQFIREGLVNIGFSGKVFSNNITFNSEKFIKLASSFEIRDDKLEIKSLNFGKSYNLKGRVGLLEPYEVELQLDIKRADIKDVALIAKVKNPEGLLGLMNGVFNIKGNLANLHSVGSVESRKGKVGPIKYDSAMLRFEGLGPIINIVDSIVKQGNSPTLTMEGYIDLRNIAKGNLFDGIRVFSDIVTVEWRGWDITKSGADELRMTKDINENMRIGFKTKRREGFTSYYDEERPEEMSLEYKMGIERLKMKLKEGEEFFGIEHNIKF